MSGVLVLAEPPTTARLERSEWWLLDRLALAWSALSALSLYALIGRGGWYVDDFLNFGLAKRYPLDLHYLNLPIFGHPQPATRLVNWLLYRISPMNYPLAAALICLAVGAMSWLLYRILRLAFRPSPWHLVLTAMVSSTGLWVPVSAWWAGGAEIAGCVVASMLVVHALLRCYRGRHRLLWGLLAGFWLLLGLTWYERALFGAAFAAWFVPAVSCRSVRPRQLLTVLRRAWPGYLALLVVAVGYLSYYLSHHFVQRQPGYSRAELAHFFWVCWSHAMIPGMFGGSLTTGHLDVLSYASPPLWWLTACQLVLLALVGYGLFRNRWRAALAWLVFAMFFLVAQYTIATARLTVHHARIGQEFRYLADLLPLLVLTVAITVLRPAALLPAAAEDAAAEEAAGGPTPGGPARRQLLAAGAASAVLAVVYLTTALPVSNRWVHSAHVSYVRNLRASVVALDRHGPWSLYTTYTPDNVSPAGYGHYSQTPEVARLITDRPVSADDPAEPMYVADQDGRLKPATLQPIAMAPDVCSSTPRKVLLELSQPMPIGYWNLQLHYDVSAPTVLQFAVDRGSGALVEATGTFRRFPVSGSGELTFAFRETAIHALRLELATGGGCVSDVRIGIPKPTG